jgi:hypothetical protein
MTSNSKQNSKKTQVFDTLVSGVKTLVRRRATPWVGTMTLLDEALQDRLSKLPQNWPGSPSALRVTLNQVVNRLRNAGIRVRFTRSTDHARTRLVVFSTR